MGDEIKLKYACESIPVARVIWIGVLQGTWREMGIQYGERTGRDIQTNFDNLWEGSVLTVTKDPRYTWQKVRAVEERPAYCLAYVRKQVQETLCLAPEIIEFWEGIAEGATKELDKCVHAGACTHFEKIACINCGFFFHPGHEEEDCCGFWVKGAATRTGETFATLCKQGSFVNGAGARQIAYVGIPKDPNARVFWASDMAGSTGGGAGVLNDCGVCIMTAGGQYKEANEMPDETLAAGVRGNRQLGYYAVIFSKTAREAADKITIGTPRYRVLTGRKAVMRARGSNLMVGDLNECYCVEQNACHYAIRTPGYLGERDGNYIVIANHFNYKDGSYDENNIWNTQEPMTLYCPVHEGSSTYWRFWSGMWMLHNHYGEIDRDMFLRELVTSHVGYDEEGKRYDPDPVTGAPTVLGTWCDHRGDRSEEAPLGQGGNYATGAFVLNSLEAYWAPAWPCHYNDKSWNCISLGPFSEYRKLLWGY